jgi:hypothetical protein
MEFYVLISLCAASVAALIAGTRSARRDQERWSAAWAAFAAAHGLGLERSQALAPRLAGAVKGVTVALFVRNRGKQRALVLRCDLGGALPDGVTVSRASLVGELLAKLRPEDARRGLEALASFRLEPLDGGARAVLADAAVQQELLRLARLYPTARIGNGVLELERPLWPLNAPNLDGLLEDGLRAVRALRRAAGAEAAPVEAVPSAIGSADATGRPPDAVAQVTTGRRRDG